MWSRIKSLPIVARVAAFLLMVAASIISPSTAFAAEEPRAEQTESWWESISQNRLFLTLVIGAVVAAFLIIRGILTVGKALLFGAMVSFLVWIIGTWFYGDPSMDSFASQAMNFVDALGYAIPDNLVWLVPYAAALLLLAIFIKKQTFLVILGTLSAFMLINWYIVDKVIPNAAVPG